METVALDTSYIQRFNTFDYLFEFITKIRFSNNSYELNKLNYHKILVMICPVAEETQTNIVFNNQL